MKMSPTHRVSVNLLAKGTQAIINHTCHVCMPEGTPESIANGIRAMYSTTRPDEATPDKTFFVGMQTAAGAFQVSPEKFDLLSVEIIDLLKFTEVQAFVVFQEQVVLRGKVEMMTAQMPSIFRGRN